jgi:hypothetical protein
MFAQRILYEGAGTVSTWQRKLNQSLQNVINGGSSINDELYQYTIGNAIYNALHPPANSLSTVPITGFTDNGGGSYTLSWTAPGGVGGYRLKYGPGQIVDWIGFDAAGAFAFTGNPATTQNWFASDELTPTFVPAGTTVTGLSTGLVATNFMLKAGSPATSTPPTITTTNPLTSGTIGVAYSVQFTATGDTPITWTYDAVPGGLTFTGGGLLSGTPTTAGTSTINVTATNAAGSAGPTGFSLTIGTAGGHGQVTGRMTGTIR